MTSHDETLFKGTAWYYARYRPVYPAAVFELIADKFGLNKQHKVLDLGAGTGEMAIPLSKYVGEIVAVEPDPAMISEGKWRAEEANVENIVWQQKRAEDFKGEPDSFQLVVIGQALHWMEQQEVLENILQLVKQDGGLAVVTSRSVWKGKEDWQVKTVEVIKRFLGEERRAGKGTFQGDGRRHDEVIAELPFARHEVQDFKNDYSWNVEKLIGYLYSTTFATKHLFGDRVDEFEAELRQELLKINPADEFTEQQEVTVIMAWK